MLRPLHVLRIAVLLMSPMFVDRADGADSRRAAVDYRRDIKPLLQQKCAACHGALKQSSGLRLDAGTLIRRGGEGGAVVVPGRPEQSSLLARVTAADPADRMPPAGEGEHLNDAQVALLRHWIEDGAAVPEDEEIPEQPAHHWSWRIPQSAEIPTVRQADWVRNPVDAFVAAEHERRGLMPQREAPREVWLRRVFLDLTGLPPTREELHAFMANTAPSAYEDVVDNLLNRPAYGERWGRHWMDVWRYSDWYGSRAINEIRYSQRHVWRWRDWIVESLNADKPYDRMVMEMLAGDELAPADPETLRATGFLGRNWYKFDRNVWMFETVEQTSQAFLALTMRCARCHDHKYDPVTQEDYYRFRAFFEPHDVRTDPISADLSTEKDATLGPVLKAGVARVFDKQADAPTWVFQRGDNRYPDQTRVITPGVPAVFGSPELAITPVSLPVEAWYPSLRSEITDGLLMAAAADVQKADDRLQDLKNKLVSVDAQIAAMMPALAADQAPVEPQPPVVLHDMFEQKSDVWNVVSGQWSWEDGKLTENSVGNFATVVANVTHPRNFQARLRYRTLAAGSYRSVGFSFDYVDQGHSQDVYTSSGDASQTVQAFHRTAGQQHYPAAGIVKTTLVPGDITTVEVTVREQQLTIRLNGQHMLDYVMPVARRDGRLALWVHQGSAEFLEVDVRELVPTRDDLQKSRHSLKQQMAKAEAALTTTICRQSALRDRVAAEQARHRGEDAAVARELAVRASQSERQAAVAAAREAVLQAESHLETVSQAESAGAAAVPAAPSKGRQEADQKLAEAGKKLREAEADAAQTSDEYTPLGESFPKLTTGRRLALARWIASPQNPRTARVAVNHMWLRHFGQALVPSVANFGLNGAAPTHPQLLDWLAGELLRQGWRMKPLHRLVVLSATYRQSATTAEETPGMAIDPANVFLWRMNSRRMEAEVVRDALLFAAGSLDATRGGPEIPETNVQTVLRRSLYFRNTPNEKAAFLETFDGANPNECYRRQESVVPQQALALMNSSLALDQARLLAHRISSTLASQTTDDQAARTEFITAAFEIILSRAPTDEELVVCRQFLEQNQQTVQQAELSVFPAGGGVSTRVPSTVPQQRARENLVHVLWNHNDFVTIR